MDFTTEELVAMIRYSMPDGMKDKAEEAFYNYLDGIRQRGNMPAVEIGRERGYDDGYAQGFDAGMYALGDMIGADEEWYDRILRPSQEV